jgi:hypothetical protein
MLECGLRVLVGDRSVGNCLVEDAVQFDFRITDIVIGGDNVGKY